MSSGQSYIVRLLRRTEKRLSMDHHAVEASKVGKIVQKLALADDVDEALDALHQVDGFSEFALRLMWQLDIADRGMLEWDNGAMDDCASLLAGLLVTPSVDPGEASPAAAPPEGEGRISAPLLEVGRVIEDIKRRSMPSGAFKGIEENQLSKLLNVLASLGEQAVSAGSTDLSRLAATCSDFVLYVIDHALFHDVRVVNILDTVNLTLQTMLEAAGLEADSSIESAIQLLNQPEDLLA